MLCDELGFRERIASLKKEAKAKNEAKAQNEEETEAERIKKYLEKQEKEKHDIIEKAKKKAELKKEAEAKLKKEAEAKAKKEAEAKLKKEAEEKAKKKAEAKAKKEAAAKAKLEEEKNIIEKFKKDVQAQIYSKYRGRTFDIMAKIEIPLDVIQTFLCMNWDIIGEYLDPEENESPWKYNFTKIMNGVCGEFIMRKYIHVYELEDLEDSEE